MKCEKCGAETGANWKRLCLPCWKENKGIQSKPKNSEPAKTGTYPLYVVYQHHDPRICGDNYSEVYDKVEMIDTLDECKKFYQRMKQARRFCGGGIPVTSYTYPRQIKENETLTIGEKNIIYRARNHISTQEKWEIEHGF